MFLDGIEIVFDDFGQRSESNISQVLWKTAGAFFGGEEFTKNVDGKSSEGCGRFNNENCSHTFVKNSIACILVGGSICGNLFVRGRTKESYPIIT